MKILVVPDSFKGSLSTIQVAKAIGLGVRAAIPGVELVEIPIADGGEGSLLALNHNRVGTWYTAEALDPLGRPILCRYLLENKTAYLELAETAGLHLLKEDENKAATASTIGTGKNIRVALDQGASTIVLFIGGSATNDGGCGIAYALGYRFLDHKGTSFLPTGATLGLIREIIVPAKSLDVDFRVLCDVKNPFTGSDGATYIYGAQKGASPMELEQMEIGMQHLEILFKRDLGVSVGHLPGSGAAGGVGGGMVAFFGANIESGIEYLIRKLDLEQAIKEADLVFTGEGKIDQQTKNGKLITGITQLANMYHKPVIGLCGVLDLNYLETKELGLAAAFSILPNLMSRQEAMSEASFFLTQTSSQIMGLLNSTRLWMKN